jgi:hypothetical protein
LNLTDIKQILAGPYKAEIVDMGGTECAVCDYFGREFWVYLMPDDKVEQLVFSYMTDKPIAKMSDEELNEFHCQAHVGRVFHDERDHLNFNAKLIGRFEDLSIKSFVMFMEAWMNDFDRLLPTLSKFEE